MDHRIVGSTGLPFVLLFPYLDAEPDLLKGLLGLFQGVHLLQPAFAVSGPFTEQCEGKGWVQVHRPLRLDVDAIHVRRLMRDFERLASIHQDSGYLSYLKHGGLQWMDEEAGEDVLREIKRYGQKTSGPDELESLRGQLLLQLAQDLDLQRREIRDALEEVGQVEKALRLGMGIDLEDDDVAKWGMEPLPSVEEDEFLIPQRLRAWAEILRAYNAAPRPFLLTENRLAVEHLLERGATTGGEGTPGPVSLLRVTLPRFYPRDLRDVGAMRVALAGLLPWTIFCEHFLELLWTARKGTFSEKSLGEISGKARALASYFQDSVWEAMLEAVMRLEAAWEKRWSQWAVEVILFPGQEELFLLEGGKEFSETRSGANAVILYMDDDCGLVRDHWD